MIWYVSNFRDRVSLRFNGEPLTWCIKTGLGWEYVDNRIFGSATAVIKGQSNGIKVTIASLPGQNATIILADMRTNKTIGSLNIREDGALLVSDATVPNINAPLPISWQAKVIAILGLAHFGTFNITDIQGEDEDIIRYRPGNEKIHVPRHYGTATKPYDLGIFSSYKCGQKQDSGHTDTTDDERQSDNEGAVGFDTARESRKSQSDNQNVPEARMQELGEAMPPNHPNVEQNVDVYADMPALIDRRPSQTSEKGADQE